MDLNFDPLNMDADQTRAWSSHVVGLLEDNSEQSRKEAALSMTNYLRPFNREASFVTKFMEATPWDESERWNSLTHDQPAMLIEVEPDSAGAEVVDFGSVPETFYPYGKRIPLVMQEVQTQRIVKHVIELGAYKYNFRTVLTDLLSLKLAFLRDSRFMRAVNNCLAPVNDPLDYTGKPNNVTVGDPWDYHTWQRSMNIMRTQPNNIEPAAVLFSHVMLALVKSQLVKDFAGTQVAVDIFRTGITELKMEGDNVRMVATNKESLVPPGKYFYFGPENQLGRYVQMYEPTMVVENRALKISFSLYEVLGMVIANQAAVAAAEFEVD